MDPTRLISSVFPTGISVAALTALPAGDGLRPEEEPFVRTAIEKRRVEFTLGRVCARQALARLGVPQIAIPVGERRSPVWPDGIVGSISHCPGLAAAAVSRASAFAGIGLDIEPASPVGAELFPQIATERERLWLAGLPGPSAGQAARCLFSAKESVYKSVNPLLGIFLGFQECEVELDISGGVFVATLRSGRLPEAWNGRILTGRHAQDGAHLATGVALAAGSLPPA